MHHLATPKREREELRAILSGEFPDGEVARWIMRDLGEAAPSRHFYDPRIARLVDEISRAPEHEFSIIELAARAGLSPSRVSHLFRDEIGLSPGKMHMWQRLRAVSRDFAHHRSLTRAAQVAGFFDSAHLSHAFRKSFGIAPSRLLARETSILDHGAV
jgi:AraC-like DNA-binding protein